MSLKTSARTLVVFCGAATSVQGQVVIGGISFVDRAATGQITLGNIRGGLAVLDYDSDGFPDLVIADNTGLPDRLFHNVPDPARPGQRKFADVTNGSGFDSAGPTSRPGFGVITSDYDNDGDPDVFMTAYVGDGTHGLLMRNDGGGVFTDVSIASGVRGSGYVAESACWMDYDVDGFVDLFICCQTGSVSTFRLLHNNRNGTFTPMPGLLPTVGQFGHIYAHTWFDYDQDGYPDGFILNNSGAPILLKNVSDGAGGRRFTNVGAASGYTFLGPAPMGIAAGDFDGDGLLDLSITDAATGTYYRNLGGGLVQRVTPFATFFGWGTTWIDAENDGDLDNYQVGSFGSANLDHLTRNLGNGLWDDVSAALNTTSLASQHMVQVDFNNDGRQDLITINPGTPGQFVSVLENASPSGNHWFKVRLRGDGVTSNTDSIGAIVRIYAEGRMQVREVISGSSTTSTEDLRPNFGLGAATVVDRVEVLWPRAGNLVTRTTVYPGPFSADQILTLSPGCYANCDGSTGAPTLNSLDFQCFLNLFAAGDSRANCDGSAVAPVLNASDFACFLSRFAEGCP